jgi:cellulose synthase (UDP-forming)
MSAVATGKRLLDRLVLGLPSTARSGRLTTPSSQRFGAWWTRHPRLLYCFVALSLCWSATYLTWRIGFSGKGAEPVLWGALLLAELYGVWNLATLAWMTWDGRSNDAGVAGDANAGDTAAGDGAAHSAAPRKRDPSPLSVDVYVCTYDEPLHVLEATLAGCALLDGPHATYVLDDGRREEVAALAREWDATWITRPDNSHAKAGNINHALPLTGGDLVLVLDADHVPMPDALRTLCAPFADPQVALVQSPHDFSNHDSIQHYDLGRHEQSLFFSVICPGKDRHGAAFWCGSGATIRRQALLEVGGVATETIAEDFHTTIKLHKAGWRSRYEPRTVVQGRAPHDLAAYLLQRDRWARGNLAVFATPESPLRARGLTKAQRLSYLASLTGYLAGPVRLLLLCTLTAVLWSAALPLRIAPLALAVLWVPATSLSVLAGAAVCRGVQSTAEACHFELCTAEIFTRALRCVARPGRARFLVTPKEGVDHGGWQSLKQFRAVLTIAVLLSLGIALRVAQDLGVGFLPPMRGFAAWFVPLLGAIELRRVLRTLLLAGRRRQLRSEYRTPVETAALVQPLPSSSASSAQPPSRSSAQTPSRSSAQTPSLVSPQTPSPGKDDVPLLARVSDVTASGLGFELAEPLPAGSKARLTLHLPGVRDHESPQPVTIEVRVRSCRQAGESWRIGAEISSCGRGERRRLVEYCSVVWPYRRLRGAPISAPADAPEPATLTPEPATLTTTPAMLTSAAARLTPPPAGADTASLEAHARARQAPPPRPADARL